MTERPPWFTYFIPPPALAIAFTVISLFGVAYWQNPNNEMLIGALISAFTGAVGFYLGSSKGAQDNRDQLNKQSDKLADAAAKVAVSTAPAPTPGGTVSLLPGESVRVDAPAGEGDGELPSDQRVQR